MGRKILLAALASSALFGLEITKTDIPIEIGGSSNYKFFPGATATGIVRLELANKDDLGEFEVEVGSLQGSFASDKSSIAYQAAKNPLLNSASGRFTVNFTKEKGSKEIPLILSLEGERILAPGTYVAELPVRILKEEQLITEQVVTAFFYVEEQLEARLYLDGEEHEEENISVAFGEIEGKAEKELVLTVRANTDVKISVTSQNNGRLILNGEEDPFTPYYIPYTLQSRGEEISLLTKTTLLTEKFNPNMKEITTDIKLLVNPDMKKSFSGKYRDRICITISPQ